MERRRDRALGWVTMPRRLLSIALLPVALAACEFLLDAPVSPAPEVRFQLAPVADTTMARVLENTNRIRVRLTRDGITKDTLLGARYRGGGVSTRARITPPPGSGPIAIFAEALVEEGVVFEGNGTISAGPNPSATVLLTPVAARFLGPNSGQLLTSLGAELQLWSEIRFVTGELWEEASATWTSNNLDIIDVDSDDRASPRGNGSTTLIGRYQRLTREITVRVLQTPGVITSITPGDTTITVGDSLQVGVTGEDISGAPLLPGAAITWETEGGISISFLGLVRAIAPGPATVTAVLGTVRHSVLITVLPSP